MKAQQTFHPIILTVFCVCLLSGCALIDGPAGSQDESANNTDNNNPDAGHRDFDDGITAGNEHTCIWTEENGIYWWGSNATRQLGINNNEMWCWGKNDAGQPRHRQSPGHNRRT